MSVEIKEVASKGDLNTFVNFPHSLYHRNPYWVPPLVKDELVTLNKQKNPSFDSCHARLWLAYKDGVVAGRIAGIINKDFLKKWKRPYARFGWMDFIDDTEVSDALLGTVEKWALRHHMTAVHGPLGFTDFDPEGLLLDGFNKESVMTTIYNFPYYIDHLKRNHYDQDVVWVEFEVDVPAEVPDRIQRMAKVCRERYGLRALDVRYSADLLPYARDVFYLINRTYSHLYGTVDLRERQIDFYLDQFFTFIDPDYCSIILNNDDQVVAFAIAMPSLSKALKKSGGKIFPLGWFYFYQSFRNSHTADLYMIAVHPRLRKRGVTGLIIEDLIHKFRKHKITKAYTHPILEQNGAMVNFWKQFQRTEFRKRGCFIKKLESGHEVILPAKKLYQ